VKVLSNEAVAKQKDLQIQVQNGVQIQRALDTHHGHVLLIRYLHRSTPESKEDLCVWDPVRGDLRLVPR
jgi:hypothetical protein